jgi:hypothetical protein
MGDIAVSVVSPPPALAKPSPKAYYAGRLVRCVVAGGLLLAAACVVIFWQVINETHFLE